MGRWSQVLLDELAIGWPSVVTESLMLYGAIKISKHAVLTLKLLIFGGKDRLRWHNGQEVVKGSGFLIWGRDKDLIIIIIIIIIIYSFRNQD